MQKSRKYLTRVINNIADITGHAYVFASMVLLIIAWFVAGIFFRYDETWFNLMDIFIFLVTFLLVFIVQASQNADTQAIQDKLDELLKATTDADTRKEAEEKRLKRGEEE